MAATKTPQADLTVTEHLLSLAPARQGRPALVDSGSGRTISYADLAATVRMAAAGLLRRGVRPGDLVAVHVRDAVAFVLASQAIRAAGGVPAPVSPDAGSPDAGGGDAGGGDAGGGDAGGGDAGGGDVAGHLTRCDARILITDRRSAGVALDLAERSRVRQVICFGEVSGATRFDDLLCAGTVPALPRTGDDLALLAAVRAADGSLRPAPIKNRELATRLRQLTAEMRLGSCDVVVAAPVCGDGRRYSALLDAVLASGATVVAASAADEQVMLAAARAYQGTVIVAPLGIGLAGCGMRVVTVPP
jgi:hypothetical protein